MAATTWTGTLGAGKEIAESDLKGGVHQGTGDGRLSPLPGDPPPDDLDVQVRTDLLQLREILLFVAPAPL